MKMLSEERGFTLVELAIVMVIIGLLIGAVLKGQAMIDDAKQKRLLNDIQGLSAAYFTYYDRYGAIPGDDTSTHGWGGVAAGDGDGFIEQSNTTDGQEAHEAWQALRYAGLISGDPAATGAGHVPSHPYSNKFNFGSGAMTGIGTKNYIRTVGIAGSIGESIDNKFDDGVWNSGTVQADQAYTNATVDLDYAL